MPKITFINKSGKKIIAQAQNGDNLLEVAHLASVPIDAPCNGSGTCGKCKMRIIKGELKSEISRHLSEEEWEEGWRLSCESWVDDDLDVEVPETAEAFRAGIRTADLSNPRTKKAFEMTKEKLEEAGFLSTPAVFTRLLKLSPPSLDDTMPDAERVERAISAEFDGLPVRITFHAFQKLALVLRESDFQVCVVLARYHGYLSVLDVFGTTRNMICAGVAIDIGTTTVSAILVNLETGELLAQASAGNSQIVYGADVINRIIESSKPGGRERLKKAVTTETIVPLITELCAVSGVPKSQIYRVSVAGNTTMEHLLMGLYADPIRMEPYIPTFFIKNVFQARNVIPGLAESCQIALAPNVGSYVGGDITAGTFASGLWNDERLTLFIDLGTNGEMVIGNSEYMLCCACSAGPAFEGGDVSCGMRATNGAIEAITIDAETMEPTMSIIGDENEKPIGLCGSGIIDLVSQLFKTKIISASGKFNRQGDRVKYDEYGMGRYILATAEESGSGHEVSLNEVDIDNLIRAKGAIFSAINLLLGQLGMDVSCLERILVAGGIGSGINFDNAISIGMLPDIPRERYLYIGNSSLAGAYSILLSRDAEDKINELSTTMMYSELSSEPGYMDEFISACFLPHTNSSLFPSVQ